MKKSVFIIAVALVCSFSFGELQVSTNAEYYSRVVKYIYDQTDSLAWSPRSDFGLSEGSSGLVIDYWAIPCAKPTEVMLPSFEEALILTNQLKYLKKVNGAWVLMDESERLAVDYAEAVAQQTAKPAIVKQGENEFFNLSIAVLQAVGDERATNMPPVKLGLEELNSLIESVAATNFQVSVTLALKLLAVNSALVRYEILWWDNAAYHPEIVE
jgi:hypothetical protein